MGWGKVMKSSVKAAREKETGAKETETHQNKEKHLEMLAERNKGRDRKICRGNGEEEEVERELGVRGVWEMVDGSQPLVVVMGGS